MPRNHATQTTKIAFYTAPLLGVFFALPTAVNADRLADSSATKTWQHSECNQQAKTPLEHSYCEIRVKQPDITLPNFYQFQKNTPQVQYLLLKNPAKKLAITLKKPNNKKNNRSSPVSTTASTQITPTTQAQSNKPTSRPSPPPNTRPLANCQLWENAIVCPGIRYQLLDNRPLAQLPAHALENTNQLQLTPFDQRRHPNQSRYLTTIYRQYIEKMLLLGLADSTMSYTKFVALYAFSEKHQQDFAKRLQAMYETLKENRRSNSIRARYTTTRPKNLTWCMPLSQDIVICDNKVNNWIYQAQR